ncbi:hypothetical protein ACCO45_012726 [Purpureocillium lilacinum]|uniref:Uncharacterized protein n=1 Tax=Purpureocillium lilacinum TaxID=33203 RepID=A0ACC4D9H9_PURLI
MDDFDPSDIDRYSTFEDFFTRAHKASSRPIFKQEDASYAVVAADSRVVVYDSVSETKKLWIKGSDFSLTQLVMDTELGDRFQGGSIASFRLSPQDYHRYHSPVTGVVKLYRSMPGDYYQVDPVALRSDVDILTRNRREYLAIETQEFGDVLFVAIGATDVGCVRIHNQWRKQGSRVSKGDELGHFQFGGSSIVVAFEKGREDQKDEERKPLNNEGEDSEFEDSAGGGGGNEDGPELSHGSTEEVELEQPPTPKKKPARQATKPAQRKKTRKQMNDSWNDNAALDKQVARPQPRQNQQQMPQQQQMQQMPPQMMMQAQQKDERKNPLKLRLDLNLDVEIELRAKIHGDVTLALLDM